MSIVIFVNTKWLLIPSLRHPCSKLCSFQCRDFCCESFIPLLPSTLFLLTPSFPVFQIQDLLYLSVQRILSYWLAGTAGYEFCWLCFSLPILEPVWLNIYILLTKHEGRIGRISARGLDSTDRAQRGPYKKDQGPIFSQDGPEQAWLIRDLLYD